MARWRLAIVVWLASAFAAHACELASAPSTRWRTASENGIAWLVTPCGERFFSLGINVLDAGASGAKLDRPHYDWRTTASSLEEWSAAARTRAAQWGFNSAGAWSLKPDELEMPTVVNLELGRLARFHWFDPFDPATAERVKAEAVRLTQPYRSSPYRIGYFSDNEVGWWGGALFVFFSQKPADNFTKQRWVALLRELYGEDWGRFAADFVPPAGIADWEALLRAEAPTKLRPGGNGAAAVRRWTQVVAERYYALASAAIKAADPDALFFGDRLPIYYDPVAVKAEAPYVDAIATNYNVDSPEGWVAPYYFAGLATLAPRKPVLVSEWFFAARENRTGNRNNGHLMTVETQAERATGAAAATLAFARIPAVLGLHWFQYYDYPVGGRADSEDYNFGLVDIRDQPYGRLTAALGEANRRVPAVHAKAHAPGRQSRAHFVAPKAAIDPAHASLIDWPKPASLLPPLTPSPGEIAFGEAYLAWSDHGLALATIGQDYYDLDLLAFAGEFPLGEAYHLELDVDAGAGPKRFTLYFIPPATKTKDHPPMAPLLCAGGAVEGGESGCAPVPGGQALYFGADQPRIAAEMLLPWRALGLAGPPPSRRLKVDVQSTAWFRSRSMALRWMEVRLGPAPTL